MQSLSELQSCHVLNYVFSNSVSQNWPASPTNKVTSASTAGWSAWGHANNEHKTSTSSKSRDQEIKGSMDQWIKHSWDQVKWLSNGIILNNAFSSLLFSIRHGFLNWGPPFCSRGSMHCEHWSCACFGNVVWPIGRVIVWSPWEAKHQNSHSQSNEIHRRCPPLGPQLSGVRTARADAATVRRSTCKLAEIDHLRCFWFFRDITKFHLNAKQHVDGEIWWNSQ